MKKINLYSQVNAALCGVSGNTVQGHALKRLNTLSGLICGMIRKGSSHLADIGTGLPQDIDAHSKEIAAKRFLENKWTGYEEHYLPFVKAFLAGILSLTPYRSNICLVIDGSQIGNDHATLMISLVWAGRGIPLCWFTKPGGKGHFTEQDHINLVKRAQQIIHPMLSPEMTVTLLGDGEFDGIELIKTCQEASWYYVVRTACDTWMFENNDPFQARNIRPCKTSNCFFIPNVEFTRKRFQFVNFVCWFDRKKYEEPIFLISNLKEARDIIDYYNQRFCIERLFKNLKSSAFNIHKTRLKDATAVCNLVMVAALAFLLSLALALQFEDDKPLRKKIQRVRPDRNVLSFFSFAYELILYFLDKGIPFNFSFQFSKNFDT